MKQVTIPIDLSPQRYISGMSALNLPAPENTTGDWHFTNHYYCHDDRTAELFIAGERGLVDTCRCYGTWGLYECSKTLSACGLAFDGRENWAANHSRAILDLLFWELSRGDTCAWLQGRTEEWLDTPEQKALCLAKAHDMEAQLAKEQIQVLTAWIEREQR